MPTSANCGDASFSYQDARRTAGNTNDYNGKMLRFNPVEIPDSLAAADRRRRARPTRCRPRPRPTARTCSRATRRAARTRRRRGTKPEIYAMGLRNPSRLSIDPKTDIPYTAWVGPDAGAPSRTEGPSTYENAAQITHAGNYGWPYCMGNKQPYRDRIDNRHPAHRQPDGLQVRGGPADRRRPRAGTTATTCATTRPTTPAWSCFPHTTGTGADAGKVRGNNLWYSRGNPTLGTTTAARTTRARAARTSRPTTAPRRRRCARTRRTTA